jgi:hypothetical protein
LDTFTESERCKLSHGVEIDSSRVAHSTQLGKEAIKLTSALAIGRERLIGMSVQREDQIRTEPATDQRSSSVAEAGLV